MYSLAGGYICQPQSLAPASQLMRLQWHWQSQCHDSACVPFHINSVAGNSNNSNSNGNSNGHSRTSLPFLCTLASSPQGACVTLNRERARCAGASACGGANVWAGSGGGPQSAGGSRSESGRLEPGRFGGVGGARKLPWDVRTHAPRVLTHRRTVSEYGGEYGGAGSAAASLPLSPVAADGDDGDEVGELGVFDGLGLSPRGGRRGRWPGPPRASDPGAGDGTGSSLTAAMLRGFPLRLPAFSTAAFARRSAQVR